MVVVWHCFFSRSPPTKNTLQAESYFLIFHEMSLEPVERSKVGGWVWFFDLFQVKPEWLQIRSEQQPRVCSSYSRHVRRQRWDWWGHSDLQDVLPVSAQASWLWIRFFPQSLQLNSIHTDHKNSLVFQVSQVGTRPPQEPGRLFTLKELIPGSGSSYWFLSTRHVCCVTTSGWLVITYNQSQNILW